MADRMRAWHHELARWLEPFLACLVGHHPARLRTRRRSSAAAIATPPLSRAPSPSGLRCRSQIKGYPTHLVICPSTRASKAVQSGDRGAAGGGHFRRCLFCRHRVVTVTPVGPRQEACRCRCQKRTATHIPRGHVLLLCMARIERGVGRLDGEQPFFSLTRAHCFRDRPSAIQVSSKTRC